MVRLLTTAKVKECDAVLRTKVEDLHKEVLQRRSDISIEELEDAYKRAIHFQADSIFGVLEGTSQAFIYSALFLVFLFIATPAIAYVIEQVMQIRCLVPNNYLIWEATR